MLLTIRRQRSKGGGAMGRAMSFRRLGWWRRKNNIFYGSLEQVGLAWLRRKKYYCSLEQEGSGCFGGRILRPVRAGGIRQKGSTSTAMREHSCACANHAMVRSSPGRAATDHTAVRVERAHVMIWSCCDSDIMLWFTPPRRSGQTACRG